MNESNGFIAKAGPLRIACPFDLLVGKYLDKVLENRLHLEIGMNGEILERFTMEDFKEVAELLMSHNLSVTVHAPFTDLPLGSINSSIRRTAIFIQKQAIDVACMFNVPQMVIHTGFDPKHHGAPDPGWAARLTESVKELMDYTTLAGHGLVLAMENTFEHDPSLHHMLFSRIHRPGLGFCFDMAHQVVFSTSTLDTWLGGLCGERLVELHLHDNHGQEDEHLAVGHGVLDFDALFHWLKVRGMRPVLTIEAHDENAVLPAIKAVEKYVKKYLDGP